LYLLLPFDAVAAADSLVIFSNKAPSAGVEQPAPVIYWKESRDTPRLLRIHFLRIDLQSTNCQVFTIISDDPDARGPAEATLEEPGILAASHNAIAAINANGFQSLKTTNAATDNNWFKGKPVNITGLAVSNGVVRSKPSASHFPLWIDFDGKLHIGNPDAKEKPSEAVSDWSGLLVHRGKIIASSTEKLHPRTLLGYDKTGRWLFMVVVDGRQPEYSDGLYLSESAELMRNLGCHEAIAMDGGGSSIMIAMNPSTGKLTVLNRPAEEKPRPVPVMLGVRQRINPR